jgi:hypothetical protein
MAEPSRKAEAVERLMKELIGVDRRDAIRADKCQPPPIGCGGDALKFRDALSKAEYAISGLCQRCQDEIFRKLRPDEPC